MIVADFRFNLTKITNYNRQNKQFVQNFTVITCNFCIFGICQQRATTKQHCPTTQGRIFHAAAIATAFAIARAIL